LEYACASSIDHVLLITNGVRIAEERRFVEVLSRLRSRLEIYLQFDSLDPVVLRDIRGEDLSEVRRRSVSVLNEFDIPTTLVCVVKRGINDHRCGEVVRYALSFTNIRGVTFQPVKASGRNESLTGTEQLIDLGSVRNRLLAENLGFGGEDLLPHPMNPENICIGYLLRASDSVRPVTKELCGSEGHWKPLGNSLFVLPKHDMGQLKFDALFRVAIISFMDKYTFARELLPYSPVGFITPSGLAVPLDAYYMFEKAPVGH